MAAEVEEAVWLTLRMAVVPAIVPAQQIPPTVAAVAPPPTAHIIIILVSHVVAALESDRCDVPPSANKIVHHMAAALPSQPA